DPRAPGGDPQPPGPPEPDSERSRPEARRARTDPEPAPGGARPAGAAEGAPRRGDEPARRSPRRRVQDRPARHGHRDPRVARVRRPPDEGRLHAAHLAPGPAG